jgi:hypothetical protein
MRHTGLQNQTEHGSESLTVNRPDICRPSYWNSFPINSPENVRRWWEDRTSDTNLRPFLIGSEKGPATNKPPAADEHVGISSLSGIADSNNPGSHQFTDTVEETSNMGIMNTDLQESASEAELGGDNTPRSNARHGSTGNIPFQHGSVHPREDATPVSNEDGEGVLKLPSQFKLDFVW